MVAREVWEGVAEARVRTVGAEHPETLATRPNFADCAARRRMRLGRGIGSLRYWPSVNWWTGRTTRIR